MGEWLGRKEETVLSNKKGCYAATAFLSMGNSWDWKPLNEVQQPF